MGCDIHMYTELKVNNPDNAEGFSWINCDKFMFDKYAQTERREELYCNHIYGWRNYTLFAILAGVRAYSSKVSTISKPRGLPHNINFITKKEYDWWGGDAHSASWLTLRELINYFNKYEDKVIYKGMVSSQDVENLKRGILPRMSCQYTNAKDWVQAEWEGSNSGIATIISALKERLWDCHPELKYDWDRDKDPNPYFSDIRIVFWFDN